MLSGFELYPRWMPLIDGHFDDCTKEVLKELEDSDSDTNEEVQSNTNSEI